MNTYRIRVRIGLDANLDGIFACIIARSWVDRAAAQRFIDRHLRKIPATIVESTIDSEFLAIQKHQD